MSKKLPTLLLASDVESSDLNPDTPSRGASLPGQCLSIAVQLLDTNTLEEKARFYRKIRFDPSRFNWSEGAASVHGMTIEELQNEPTMADVARELWAFLEKHMGENPKILFAAHNPNFDTAFFRQVMGEINISPKLIYRQVDAFTAGYVVFGLEESDQQVDFLDRSRGDHDAMEDITNSVDMLRLCRKAGTFYRHRYLWLALAALAGLTLGIVLF